MTTMNNPSQPVQGSMLYVTTPAAPPAMATEAPRNSNIWKPSVNAEHREYAAVIRQLPAGRNLNAYPSVMVINHYLNDPVTKVKLTIKCCKNVPGQQRCPICDDIWGRWRAITKSSPAGKEDPQAKQLLRYTEVKEWYTNVYIRADENEPKNNGTVKLWKHSDAQHNDFAKPLQNDAPAAQNTVGQVVQRKKDPKFTPYCPMTGHDYTVQVTWNTAKAVGNRRGMADYGGCFFHDEPTMLAAKQVTNPDGSIGWAPDEEAMLAILDQCHDLNALLNDVPSQQEALAAITKFWADVEAAQTYGGQAVSSNPAYAVGGPQVAQPAPQMPYGAPGYAQQPYAPSVQAQPMAQADIPHIPQQANVTVANPNAFMGVPQGQTPAYAPVAPQAPVAPAVPASPLAVPGAVATGAVQAPPTYAAAPAAPVAPAAPQAYAAPQPPMAPGAPMVETDDDDDLPF